MPSLQRGQRQHRRPLEVTGQGKPCQTRLEGPELRGRGSAGRKPSRGRRPRLRAVHSEAEDSFRTLSSAGCTPVTSSSHLPAELCRGSGWSAPRAPRQVPGATGAASPLPPAPGSRRAPREVSLGSALCSGLGDAQTRGEPGKPSVRNEKSQLEAARVGEAAAGEGAEALADPRSSPEPCRSPARAVPRLSPGCHPGTAPRLLPDGHVEQPRESPQRGVPGKAHPQGRPDALLCPSPAQGVPQAPDSLSRGSAPEQGEHTATLGPGPRARAGSAIQGLLWGQLATRDSSRHATAPQRVPDHPDQNPLGFLCQPCLSCLSSTLLSPPQLQEWPQAGETAPRAAQGIYSPRWDIKITSLIAFELAQMALN